MERQFRVSFVITDESLVPEDEAIAVIKDVVFSRITNPQVLCDGFAPEMVSGLYVGRIHNQMFCTQCGLGDCYGHVDEFLNRENRVQRCTCPDPGRHHGKLRPGKR